MDVGDCLARIAETQIGTHGDRQSGRAALYGYLLATDAKFTAFEPEWARTGFGSEGASRYHLMNAGRSEPESRFRLRDAEPNTRELPVILRIHSWCAAFVDWCVMQLLMEHPQTTSLSFAKRPKTASAFGLLQWGMGADCTVLKSHESSPARGDIAVFNFSHTGIVVQPNSGHFYCVEGNTTQGLGGNQGYLVERRLRSRGTVKGFVRLPPKNRLGDYEISSRVSRTA